jgi:CheY-like chemotaxis protein
MDMALETLLLSADREVIRVLHRVLQDLGIDLLLTPTANDAADLLARRKFDAVIVDCCGLPGATEIVPRLRQGNSNRSSIVFAVIGQDSTLRNAFGLGANFVLEKPLSPERGSRTFRAALGLMVRERRRYFRLDVEVPLTLDAGDGVPYSLVTTNLSEGGLAVRAPRRLAPGAKVKIKLALPNERPIECRGEIAWSTDDGRAGMKLLMLSDAARQQLTAFIAANCDQMIPLVPASTRAWAKAEA